MLRNFYKLLIRMRFCNIAHLRDGISPCPDWRHALFFAVVLCVLLPFEAEACLCGSSHPQIYYDNADAVVLVRPIPGSGDSIKQTFEVIRSWKSKLTGSVSVYKGLVGTCVRLIPMGRLLYLKRDKDGDFITGLCAGSLSEGDPRMDARIQWLDKVSACGCPSRNAQDWYDYADAVVSADITGIREEGDKKFADLKVRLAWKAELPASISVQTEDGRGCGYPVQLGKPSFYRYLLYLRRDESGQFSTGFCSGNLDPFEYNGSGIGYGRVSRLDWLFEQEKPKKPKELN
jgi:hypothetical protein